MEIFCLLKGKTNLAASFHGVATSKESADAWEAGSEENWFYEINTNDGIVVLVNPINYADAENASLE